MSYSAQVSRENPGCLCFLIDQSGSMSDSFGGESGKSKAGKLADAINHLLLELTIRCTKSQEEGVRDYYDVSIIGYGDGVRPALSGSLSSRDIIKISEIADNPAYLEDRKRKIEDGAGGLVEETMKFPIWFDAVARNGTPMCEALRQARSVLSPWIQDHPDSFPPIVINLTDGEATDGDPINPARDLVNLETSDGKLLLFNLHLSSVKGDPISYPEDDTGLPDRSAKQLFEISSLLPSFILEALGNEGYAVGSQSRGFVFNANIVEVITFLDIGTRPKALR